jgi:hypothetical protein
VNRDLWIGLEAPLMGVNADEDLVQYARDRVAVKAQVPFQLYLFLIKVGPDNAPRMIWPEGPPELVAGDVRMPAEGWVELAVPQVDESLVVIAVLEGELMGVQSVLDRAGRAAARMRPARVVPGQRSFVPGEGSHSRTFVIDGSDALRVDVWAEDETLVWIDIEHAPPFVLP